MKKLFAALFVTAAIGFVSAQTISFDKTTLDYGTVKNGADGHRLFTVKNTGTKPLILSNVKASCGCTTPEWSQDPILPGKTSTIKVGYNTTITGPFTKIIEVYSNDPENSRSVINIKGTVEAAPAAAQSEVASVAGAATMATQAKVAAADVANDVNKPARAAKKALKKSVEN